MMQKTNLIKSRGITLIALVITIVVMLILAGVTINLTLGENGIFTIAQQAAKNYTDSQNKELSYLQGFTNEVDNIVNPAPLGTIIRTENGINYTADGVGNAIPVPVGFAPITEGQGTKDTGFVIKHNTDRNEFVWVPVGNVNNYKRVAWWREGWQYNQITDGQDSITKSTKITIENIDQQTMYFIEKMPIDEQNSISAYGGFYIGRYEAGIKGFDENNILTKVDGTEWTGYTGQNIKLVIQDDEQVWNLITRDRAIIEAESLYDKAKDNVKSKLCSSYAWDATLKFIEAKNSSYPTNSIDGNYIGASNISLKTGYKAINNIYDMGGNAWEWTSETFSITDASTVLRGGHYAHEASVFPAAHRNAATLTDVDKSIGYRVTLFL